MVQAGSLAQYLQELQSLPPEQPLEPELKHQRQELDKTIREEQDLASGAVLVADVEAGDGNGQPAVGDLVYINISIRSSDDDLLHSTYSTEGGSGQAFAFILEKGCRGPRAWEVALKAMSRGCRKSLKVRPDYGYQHPDCKLQPPEGVPAGQKLMFDLQLVNWYAGDTVRAVGLDSNVYKLTFVEGSGWESPRAPFEVSFTCTLRTPAYNGAHQTGFQYFSSTAPLSAQLGQGRLPEGVELALSHMTKGEKALFIVPADMMAAPQGCALPAAPGKGTAQVELELELLSMTQVRDMTGDGQVLKRRLREGTGDFPMDCPLNDTNVRLHYRARPAREPAGEWVYDSRGSSGDAPPVEFDTGCGEMPEGLEMTAKLMVPNELSAATCTARYAYAERTDCPAGIEPSDSVEFEIELVSFDREGHWQAMEIDEKIALANKMKAKGNQLYKDGKVGFAKQRYDRLIRLLDNTRDIDTEQQLQEVEELRLATVGNLALCCTQLGQHAEAVSWCTKGLELDENSAKLLFRRGKAKTLKGDHEEAEQDLARAKEMDASIAADVDSALALNAQRRKQAAQKQKSQFKNFFAR